MPTSDVLGSPTIIIGLFECESSPSTSDCSSQRQASSLAVYIATISLPSDFTTAAFMRLEQRFGLSGELSRDPTRLDTLRPFTAHYLFELLTDPPVRRPTTFLSHRHHYPTYPTPRHCSTPRNCAPCGRVRHTCSKCQKTSILAVLTYGYCTCSVLVVLSRRTSTGSMVVVVILDSAHNGFGGGGGFGIVIHVSAVLR